MPDSPRPKYVPVVGSRLKRVLAVVLALFALLVVNSVYLVGITIAEWATGRTYQDWFYLINFLIHLGLGFALILPVIIFGIFHIKNSRNRPNKRAIRVGYALFVTAILLLVTGVLLTRMEIFGFTIDLAKAPAARSIAYWTHIITPLVAMWLFVLHRLAGRRIKWKVGLTWAGVAAAFAAIMLILQTQDPRQWDVAGNPKGDAYFFPALSRTVTGDFIRDDVLRMDHYCVECHADVHARWEHSAHRISSFNNPAYVASVRGTRQAMFERDGNVQGARFCAGCHDPVPFFAGEFDKPHFDDPDYDLASDKNANAGITCTACHAITNINTNRGNGDYTIDEPQHYPFTFSENPALKWINRQLVKAKPAFHKKTFLKPLHQSTEFCGTCHKVHLPPELNAYKWLRGQNHQDPFRLSGVSGSGVTSFYYPPKAEENCNNCHMPTLASDDFGAKVLDDSGELKVHDHLFPSANTAIAYFKDSPDWVNEAHQQFNEGVMRVDIFALKPGERIDADPVAPLRPESPELVPGETYLVDVVVRTVKMGHIFTQGTADSNQPWLDVTVTDGDGRVIGRSGGMDHERTIDPWSHFLNAFVLDREGNRINRRNAEDIFIPLYSNQIPPGAADVVHYKLNVPDNAAGPITFDVKLRYRKFDTEYMKFFQGDAFVTNDLPILELAQDTMKFPVAGSGTATPENPERDIPEWQRWNDYGIALLRKGERGELRQAAQAFERVEELGRPDGPLNLARVYLKEGRVTTDAPEALRRARDFNPPPYEWSLLYWSGQVNKQNAALDDAISSFEQMIEGGFEQARGKGFDFSKNEDLRVDLADTLFQRARQERGDERRENRRAFLQRAVDHLTVALEYDSELASAHYLLYQIYTDMGESQLAQDHQALHEKYKIDDNARDRAVAVARQQYPAANKAAEAVVIYDLQRPGAFELAGPDTPDTISSSEGGTP